MAEHLIEFLNLSNRSINCLKRNGYFQVSQIINFTEEDLMNLKNLGINSAREICLEIENYKNNNVDKTSEDKIALPLEVDSLNNVSLSDRVKRILSLNGITTISQLLECTKKSLNELSQINATNINEIMAILPELRKRHSEQIIEYRLKNNPERHEILKNIDMSWSTSVLPAYSLEFKEYFVGVPNIPENFSDLYLDDIPFEILCNYVYDVICANPIDSTIEYINSKLPEHLQQSDLAERTIEKLVAVGRVTPFNLGYVETLPTINEYLKSLPATQSLEAFLFRLEGYTFEEIGGVYNVTRERSRQYCDKTLFSLRRRWKKHRNVQEDCYAVLYKKYYFNHESAEAILGISPNIFRYLEIYFINCGVQDINKLMYDENYSKEIRRAAEKYNYRKCIFVGNSYIPKRRADIADYIVRSQCQDVMHFNDFEKLYNDLLKHNNLENEESLLVNTRTYLNRIADSRFVLWKYGKRFRYYPIDTFDYSELFEALDLSQYNNIEFSANKLFKDFPEIMQQYDIRDGYELHNLLKKVVGKTDKIKFNKMPMMSFGEPNRENQVLEILLEIAPATQEEFASAIQDAFGIKKNTASACWASHCSEYFHEGIYNIDYRSLQQKDADILKLHLTKDFYFMDEIKEIYKSINLGDDLSLINPYSIRQLGFNVVGKHIFSNKYSSVSDFFNHLLLDDDTINWKNYNRKLGNSVSFTTKLSKLRQSYDIIEYLPDNYITMRKLNESNITKDDLMDYCNCVARFIGDNKMFTIKTLRADGFYHKLDELAFDEWFYASVLRSARDEFSYSKIGYSVVFCKGKSQITRSSLLSMALAEKQSCKTLNLVGEIYNKYGVEISAQDISQIVIGSDLYYDSIDKILYADYNAYEKSQISF